MLELSGISAARRGADLQAVLYVAREGSSQKGMFGGTDYLPSALYLVTLGSLWGVGQALP